MSPTRPVQPAQKPPALLKMTPTHRTALHVDGGAVDTRSILASNLLERERTADRGSSMMLIFGAVACLAFFVVAVIGLLVGQDFVLTMVRAILALIGIIVMGGGAHWISASARHTARQRALAVLSKSSEHANTSIPQKGRQPKSAAGQQTDATSSAA